MTTDNYANWQRVNRQMIAKILAELEYERTLCAAPQATGMEHHLAGRDLSL